MAAGGKSKTLRSQTIQLEGMAGEGEAANVQQTVGAQGSADATTTMNVARSEAPGPSKPAPDAVALPVSLERARLREQARKGKVPSYRVATELVDNLKSASTEASQVVKDLWPNLLHDAFRFKAVPDTLDGYDGYDSQMPFPHEEDFDRLVEDMKHVGEHMKHVQSCLEEVVERAWVGQTWNDKFISDSDETDEIQDNNEGSQPTPPGPNETQPPAVDLFEDSEDSEDGMDGEAPYHVAANLAAQGGGPAPGRQLVQKDHVLRLVIVYQKAMTKFTKSKKGVAPSQLIPNKVWQQIYKEYKREFPASTFKEDSLKDHLRASLKDLKKQKESPVDCEEVEDPSQDEELMTRLMATDSWKARNVWQTRMDAMESLTAPKSGMQSKSSTLAGSSTSGQTSFVAPPKAASGGGAAAVHIPFKPPTKSQNLKDARQDMASMLGEFKAMSEDKREDSNRKRQLADGKVALHEAKWQESEERRKALEEQGKMSKITLIKEQKALGLILEDEFVEKCRNVFQL